MDIFGIGPGELMLLLVLALIVIGPQKLPEIGRTLGRTVSEFKAQTDALRSVLTFDPLTTPAPTPGSAGPTTQELDERVTALQDYMRQREETLVSIDDIPIVPVRPEPLPTDHERAS